MRQARLIVGLSTMRRAWRVGRKQVVGEGREMPATTDAGFQFGLKGRS